MMWMSTIAQLRPVLLRMIWSSSLWIALGAALSTTVVLAAETECQRVSNGLRIGVCAERCDTYQIRNAGVEKHRATSSEQKTWASAQLPGSRASDHWRDVSRDTGRILGARKLDNPAAVNPSGSYLASAAAPFQAFDEYGPKREVAVLSVASKRLLWAREYEGRLQALAWSPDGGALAVLISAPALKQKRGATDLVAGVFGWRVAHERAWVEIIGAEGTAICSVDVYEDLRTPTNYLYWEIEDHRAVQ